MKYLPALFLFLLTPMFLCAQTDKDIEAVKTLLRTQNEAWNRGDIDGFMEGYWKSDQLQFTNSNGVTFGWENTLNGYKRRYPDLAAMGKLTFEILNVTRRSKKVISLSGKYTLQRANDQPSGYFLLLFQKIKGKWRIVSDCTAG